MLECDTNSCRPRLDLLFSLFARQVYNLVLLKFHLEERGVERGSVLP